MSFKNYYNPEIFTEKEIKEINRLINVYNDYLVAGHVTEREVEFTLAKKLITKFGNKKAFEIYTNI